MRRETWVVGPVATAVDLVVSLGAYVAGMTRDHLGMPRRVLNLPHCTNFNSLCVVFCIGNVSFSGVFSFLFSFFSFVSLLLAPNEINTRAQWKIVNQTLNPRGIVKTFPATCYLPYSLSKPLLFH